jgi:hypothetical protein
MQQQQQQQQQQHWHKLRQWQVYTVVQLDGPAVRRKTPQSW